jgi:phosphoglycerate dehydrogenase-like enzyme
MSSKFLVGVTPDFLVDAKGRYEKELEQSFAGVPGLSWEIMPDQPGKMATLDAIDRYDAIFALGLKFSRESVTSAKRLALIARWGVGYDMIDTAAITENDIALAITPNAVRRPVAEAILTFVLALGTNLLTQDRLVRAGKWRGDLPKLGQNLAGRTLGSLGCGNIAQQMFRMAQSLGFGRFVAHDPFVDREAAAALNVELVDKDAVFRESDYVTVNTLLNESTRGLVGERELRLMKPTAYLINTARGPIVDQKALTRALHEGWIAGAGLDVFEVEPLPADDPIREAPNTILSPHGLPWTNEIARDNGLEACANILTVAHGEVPASVVNKDVLKRPGFLKKLESYKK